MKLAEVIPISFIDENPEVISSLVNRFRTNSEGCKFINGSIFDYGGGTLISPANRYGNMDGGIDRAYAEKFPDIEARLEKFLSVKGGMIDFGESIIVPTYDNKYPHIIFSPTIDRPGDLAHPENIRNATKAVLKKAIRYNMKGPKKPITNLLFPGLGTGYGNLEPKIAAREMYKGYMQANAELEQYLSR